MLATLRTTAVEWLPLNQVDALAPDWNELLRSSAADCVFLTWERVNTWWKHLSAGSEGSVATVREGSTLIALAPLCVRPRQLRWGQFLRESVFIGSGFA